MARYQKLHMLRWKTRPHNSATSPPQPSSFLPATRRANHGLENSQRGQRSQLVSSEPWSKARFTRGK
jgi:hypothetical protein